MNPVLDNSLNTHAPCRILIIDDEPMNIQVLNNALPAHCSTFFATNGEQGLEICRREKPDLVLLDVMMPGMNGYQVCRAIKADVELADIPVIFVSAMNQLEDEIQGLEAGGVDCITKPLNPVVVKMRIKNHLELKHYRDVLRKLAYLDGLTGLANRRFLDETLDKEWRRAVRSGSDLSLVMLDIDFFKPYNDALGHQQGDEAIKTVAEFLRRCMQRAADLVARYGGEEFVCVLPDTPLEQAAQLAEKIRQDIAQLRLPHPASSVGPYLTISAGVAGIMASSTAEIDKADSMEALIHRADQALYEAKQNGRNQVRLSRP